MSARAAAEPRSAYPVFRTIATRWMDNDVYGHVNNVVYYSFFDTAVNAFLIEDGWLDLSGSAVIGLVAETQCRYFRPFAFPAPVHAGLRVGRLGNSSIRYEVGLFDGDAATACAQGHFVHVYVDRATGRPIPLPDALRTAITPLLTDTTEGA